MSDHEELEGSVAAWVLGVLEADEADAMRIHVEGCPGCTEVAARLRRAVAALPLAVDEVAPPARLRERVLAAPAVSGSGAAAASRKPQRIAEVRSRRRPIAIRMRDRIPAYAAAAAVLLALLVGVVVGDQLPNGSAPAPTNQVARFTLVGHQDLAGARATVIDLKSDGVALVDFSGLPPLPAGRVYEVWLITSGGRADGAAVFVPDTNGGKVVLVKRSLDGYSQMAITNEPGPDGSKAPTQPPELYGNLA